MKRYLLLLLFLQNLFFLPALTLNSWDAEPFTEIEMRITSTSGTPLLLQIAIEDPKEVITGLTISSKVSSQTYALKRASSHTLAVSPFLDPGVYSLEIVLESSGITAAREITIGFSPFTWGKDNFRYSNIRSNYGSVHPYSEVLFPWAEQRFDLTDPIDLIPLLVKGYSLIGGSIGRCYAFTGSQVRYITHPELLPSYYKSVYDIRKTHSKTQNEMNMLQNDMVFDQFVFKGYDLAKEQTNADLNKEISDIKDRIAQGSLVPVGYVSAQRHHSLLIYGFISDPQSENITLVTANNWGVEHDKNLESDAAVLINIHSTGEDEHSIYWLDPPSTSYSEANHFFTVEVKDEYLYEPSVITQFIEEKLASLEDEQHMLVIVEEAKNALFSSSEGEITGRHSWSSSHEIPGIAYQITQDTHIFELPADFTGTLEVLPAFYKGESETYAQSHILILVPIPDPDQGRGFTSFTFSQEQDYPQNGKEPLLLSLDAGRVTVIENEEPEQQ